MSTTFADTESMADRDPMVVGWRWVIATLAFFLLVHFGLQQVTESVLHQDEAELIIFNQHFSWGYTEQPPLYAWLFAGFSRFFGESATSLYLFRAFWLAALVGALAAVGKRLFADRHAIWMFGFSILLLPTFAWHLVTYLTHTLAMTVLIVATLLACLNCLRSDRWGGFLLLGVSSGLGALTKYNFVFFLVPLILSGMMIAEVRQRLWHPRLAVSVLLAAVIVLPHGLWLIDHQAEVRSLLSGRVHSQQWSRAQAVLGGMIKLVQNSILLALPTLLLIRLAFPDVVSRLRNGWLPRDAAVHENQRSRVSDVDSPPTVAAADVRTWFQRWLAYYFVACGLLLVVYVVLSGSENIRQRWLEPLFVPLPLYCLTLLGGDALRRQQVKRLAWVLVALVMVITGARASRLVFGNSLVGVGNGNGSYAFTDIASELRRQLPENATLVCDDHFVGGNLRLLMPDVTIMVTGKLTNHLDRLADFDHAVLLASGEMSQGAMVAVVRKAWGSGVQVTASTATLTLAAKGQSIPAKRLVSQLVSRPLSIESMRIADGGDMEPATPRFDNESELR